MASPTGNPNPSPPPPQPSAPFELAKLFKPPNATTNPNPIPNQPPPTSVGFYGGAATPPPSGPYSYPPATPPYNIRPYMPYAQPEPVIPRPVMSYPLQNPTNPIVPNPNPSPNPGARLMQLLGNTAPSHLESAVSMPPSQNPSTAPASAISTPILPVLPSVPPTGPARMPSTKMPRGRYLGDGDRAVYDVDSRLPGEAQAPQLEVTPITKYTSDPGLVLGRQIAVNRSYIVYGLRMGNIRVLNINTALRSLLRGHTQRVTDMAFFAEDVHLLASASVDGRVFVWKIDEGPDEENKPQITGRIVIALQIVGDTESYHPHICWHSHKQEILFVGIGNRVLKIDITRVARGKEFTAEEPLKCPIDKLTDGVHVVGKHDGDITALSISQWMTTRLASASNDGMVKIWDDRKQVALAAIRPHDGQPVNCVAFLTAPERPDHINLVTAGPLNREIKVWSSTNEEGWLLPGDSESWQCTQTLDLRSSSDPQLEEAFFNQVTVIPQASLVILANAKKNAIYAVHFDYGPFPAATRMDYIADFTVAMPILSLTGTCESLQNGEQVVQVYCVQTMAIQQYALELTLCLPPSVPDSAASGLVREPSVSRADTPLSEPVAEYTTAEVNLEAPVSHTFDVPATNPEVKPSAPPLIHTENEATLHLDSLKSPQQTLERGQSSSSHGGDRDIDRRTDADSVSSNQSKEDISVLPNPRLILNPTHLITPSEILSGAISSSASPSADANRNEEFRAKETESETKKDLQSTPEDASDKLNRPLESSIETAKAPHPAANSQNMEEPRTLEDSGAVELSGQYDVEPKEGLKDSCEKKTDGSMVLESLSFLPGKGKEKEKLKEPLQATDLPSPSFVTSNPTDSNGPTEVVSRTSSANAVAPADQISVMQDMLQQLMTMHKDLQKQMSSIVSAPVTKEGKRVEASLGRNMEKSIKANVDALWARFLEENAKHEKAERDRMQQLTNLITNSFSKEIPTIFERTLKKEMTALGPIVARAVTPIVEKTISSVVAESIQKGVGDKVMNQLDKSISSKLEGSLARQLQVHFQSGGNKALQEALRSCLDASLIPAFERSCKVMFDQVDNAFHKGMAEHTSAIQQQVEAGHTPLALTLRETVASASSITQSMTSKLLDGQRKLLAMVAAGNPKSFNPVAMQPTNGLMAGLPNLVEAPVDPTKELARLISERKFEEAFNMALQLTDVSIVSWLCSQVDLHALCTLVPVPLSQGVLLALLQQLACDIANETARKAAWMTDVAVTINPRDPMIAMHVRPIFEQVYSIVSNYRAASASDAASVKLVIHVINSVLMGLK
ncbi:Enhancer of mRNA-decapping protein 4 [Rhynchospora pubera]|uniref:Enhancer of mRNA-decapping protein 4 n=1 Tax=Rhynchospora pubera TaxID=906938 RepID=A0AAV8HFU9_9POAL|nr:Enhancer of mRNA-decapping protein 4 [Rhynchospora pubera]